MVIKRKYERKSAPETLTRLTRSRENSISDKVDFVNSVTGIFLIMKQENNLIFDVGVFSLDRTDNNLTQITVAVFGEYSYNG